MGFKREKSVITTIHFSTVSPTRCHMTGLIVTACGDDCIRVFEEDKSCSDAVNQLSFHLLVTQSPAHSEDVNCVSWSPVTPGLLASCSDDGLVKLWQFTGES